MTSSVFKVLTFVMLGIKHKLEKTSMYFNFHYEENQNDKISKGFN